jgi:alanine racemase
MEGVATHFPAADGSDPAYTEEQIRVFTETVGAIRGRGIDPPFIHAANSGGITGHPASLFTMVRPGIMLYGYPPAPEQKAKLGLLPVMEFESKLVMIKRLPAGSYISYGLTYKTPRETCIGTVAAGYGDGYCRLLSNKARVLIRGALYPVAGRVCMDQFMVDLGPAADIPRYTAVSLFGPDPAGPDAADLAEIIGTIPYEVTCAVSARVPRIYLPLTRPTDGAD